MGVLLIFGRWAGALASGAAVAVAFVCANYTARHLSWDDEPLLPWKPDDPAKPWLWLPRVALVLVAVGLISRWIGMIATHYLPERRWWGANLLVWAPRIAAVALTCGWLVSEKWATEDAWLMPALGAAMLLEWIVLDGLSRSEASAEVAGYQAAIFLTASMMLLYHHWATVSFIALIVGSTMFGIAVVAGIAKADTSGAVPASVGILPGLLLAGWMSQDSKIPLAAFWIVALAPLVLLPFLIPALARRDNWYIRAIRAVLILAALAAAAVLTDKYEQPAFGAT